MTVLEAMAAGVPVVATRVGSIPQIIHHEQTGLLVDKGDADALQTAIERLLANSELSRAVGSCGQAFVMEHASVEQMADRYIAHYTDLLSKTRSAKSVLTR